MSTNYSAIYGADDAAITPAQRPAFDAAIDAAFFLSELSTIDRTYCTTVVSTLHPSIHATEQTT
jgi:hypothetical protein